MSQSLAEQALNRLMQYLRLARVAPSADVSVWALEVVRDAVKTDGQAVIPFVMDRVEEYFVLLSTDVPPPCPPIVRGSIGYNAE